MVPARLITWTLLAVGGFALAAPRTATAQDPAVPRKPDADFEVVRGYQNQNVSGGIPMADLKKARESFTAFGKFFAEVVAHPALYRAAQEVKPELPPKFPYTGFEGGEKPMFRDLDRFLLEPVAGGTKVGPNQADYIRELGRGLDAQLKELIETSPDAIVRVNACRTLAHVARTGAPAHYETVTALLANANTPTELKVYLFQAAAALLAAGDPTEITQRKHSADPKLVGALVKTLEDCIADPAQLNRGFKADTAPADQFAVVALVRRQAVKALGQVKFATLPGPDGKAPIYPAYTLVRVAMSDPALVPSPGPAEAAEAVLGLCNMQPPTKDFNADIVVEALASGLNTFATPRATNPADRTLPWRGYAVRIADALRTYRALFDPGYSVLQPTKFDATKIPPALEELYKEVVPKVLAPMEKLDAMNKPDPTAKIEVELVLRERVKLLRANPKRSKTLFEGVPDTNVEFVFPKAEK